MGMKHIIFDCDGTLIDTKHGPKYKVYPGIKELITELSKSNTLYVWTARDRVSTRRILQENGILQYFHLLSTMSDALPKPHVGGLIDLVGNVTKKSVCIIGDSGNDVIGAKSFGVMCIGAAWNPDTSGPLLKDLGADFIVSHPSECSSLIELNLGEDDV